jgi:hypothetical protein
MRKPVAAVVTIALMLASVTALAQRFGTQGDAVFSVDRLFGINGTHVYEELDPPGGTPRNPDAEVEDNFIGINFGWRGPLAPQLSPFDAPRLAFDYFVIDSLSVGGSLGYASGSDDTEDFVTGAVPPVATPSDYSGFVFAPRAGYLFMFSDVAGIWPRGGFTYHTFSVNEYFGESGLAVTLEAMFVLTPVEHFGILIGPTFDIDFTGKRDYETDDRGDVKRKYRSIGLQVGLMTWL